MTYQSSSEGTTLKVDRNLTLNESQDGAYGWSTLTASIPANYICEISKEQDSSLELLLQRDFG
ncbi:hypothetical protein CHS0354_040394 [Potamilus streckersoni]|uniref:Uncharacterized protein n=1 Tax=Potamilus streckersoni TaxID=2493646 RepID=A0AAE0S194_9BIVA|nr:hypothetical protein CHS0354_040394 [Potamilus streckersoni]